MEQWGRDEIQHVIGALQHFRRGLNYDAASHECRVGVVDRQYATCVMTRPQCGASASAVRGSGTVAVRSGDDGNVYGVVASCDMDHSLQQGRVAQPGKAVKRKYEAVHPDRSDRGASAISRTATYI